MTNTQRFPIDIEAGITHLEFVSREPIITYAAGGHVKPGTCARIERALRSLGRPDLVRQAPTETTNNRSHNGGSRP